MSNKRIDMHRLQDLVRLHRMGISCRQVATMLRMGPNTERTYRLALEKANLLKGDQSDLPEQETLVQAVLKYNPPKPAPQYSSTVSRWREHIQDMYKNGASPKAIFDCLRLREEDFSGSLSAVKRMCARLKKERGIKPDDVAIPVETAPGEVAQVDFGYAGKHYDPERRQLRKAWFFVMVLGYSRQMVVRIVFDQKAETWLHLHQEAFIELGGVPQVIVPDNLKSAVIRSAFGVDQPCALNRSYRELARHFGFTVDPTPVRDPAKKGKVESGVKYVKRNFFKPRGEMDIVEARKELAQWIRKIAGQRIHGTTGRCPQEVFDKEERAHLMALPKNRYELVIWKQAKVHRDCHISFDKRLYSVPWKLIGQQVWIRATATTVSIYAQENRVATHARQFKGPRSTNDIHLPRHRSPWRHRSRVYWEQRADCMGEEVGAYIREIFDGDEVLSRLRTVQSIVTHLEKFPRERAQKACKRARHYGCYSCQGIRNILRKALDLNPVEEEFHWLQDGILTNPRYARSPREIVHHQLEVSFESN